MPFGAARSQAIAAKRAIKQKKFFAMVAELPQPQPGTPACLLSQLSEGENVGKTVHVKVVVAVPQSGMRSNAHHQCLIVTDANEGLMALSLYALRGVALLDPGTTLELRDPVLAKIEVAKTWEAPSADGDSPPPVAGYHLLRIETPSTQLRITRPSQR